MPVLVVHLLEVVDVDEQQAAGPAVATQLVEARPDGRLGVATVPDPGEGVDHDEVFELAQTLEGGDLR